MTTALAMPDPNEHEIGHPGGLEPSWRPELGWGYVAASYEETPDLVFPWSIAVYDRMRRTDGQIRSLLNAINMPVLGADWQLDTKGVRPEVADFVRTELGMPKPGEQLLRRRRHGINWLEHLREVLIYLPLGFMPFEQVYEIAPPDADQEGLDLPVVAHLRKLAPRMPRTLTEIRVHRDGGLAGIVQAGVGIDTAAGLTGVQYIGRVKSDAAGDDNRERFIDADHLVMHVNEREGADWTGTSILRTAYKHWFIKDQLLRLGAQTVERNGMGLPVVKYDEGHTREEALALATSVRAGAHAGVAVPEGMSLELLGVTGATKDELPLVQYHDQQMTRQALAMFLDLGHDNGARSLGDTFVDYFKASLGATTGTVALTTTEYVIRDLVEQNWGPDEPYPAMRCAPINAELTAAALKSLVDAKIITPDEDLEDEVRRRHGLPKANPDKRPEPPAPAVLPGVPGPGQVQDVVQTDANPAGKPDSTQASGHADDVLTRAEALADRLAELKSGGPGV